MTKTDIRRAEVPDYDAPAIRKLLAVKGRANLARLARSGAACDLVSATESGHRTEVR